MSDGSVFAAEQSVVVKIRREELFDLLEDEGRFFELRPTAVAHRDIEPLVTGGHACIQEYEINGRRISQRCRAIEFDRPSRLVSEVVTADAHVTSTSTFDDLGDSTRLTISQTYLLPRQVNALWRRSLRGRAEHRLARSLQQIKQVAERS